MEILYCEMPGEQVDPNSLRAAKARELTELIASSRLPYVSLIETRRDDTYDYVVLDVEPEVSQRPVLDIRVTERIAVRFDPEDVRPPEPLALRQDFPPVPHLNFGVKEFPRSLCLFDEAYSEQKIHWTAARFVRQLHHWLSRTAKNELHQSDQPLERFLVGASQHVILPPSFFNANVGNVAERIYVSVNGNPDDYTLIVSTDVERNASGGAVSFQVIVMEAQPRTHGVLRHPPSTLSELHDYLLEVGCNLEGTIQTKLSDWRGIDNYDESCLLIVVRLPKRRSDEDLPETVEVWAFVPDASLSQLGEELGLMGSHEGFTVPVIGQTDTLQRADNVPLILLNPTPALTRSMAGALNNCNSPYEHSIVAVGAGALGSQLIMNLVRAGFGTWTVIDNDILLPHNLARHGLTGPALGYPKVNALAHEANTMFDRETLVSPVVADILKPSNEVAEAMSEAMLIADFSASVTVARHLTLNVKASARRVSLFLNPNGTDLILLAEDPERVHRLDQLEMCYYREIIHRSDLASHLHINGRQLRYAYSCRDVSSQISQDSISVHAGIGSRALRYAAESSTAQISIWQTDSDLCVTKLSIQPSPFSYETFDPWSLCIDEFARRRLLDLRREKLPNETGGVLIGSYDLQRKIVYVVDTLASPPDSEEWPTLYIRGSQGGERCGESN